MSDLNPSSRSAALGCIVYVHHCTIVLHLDGDTYFSSPPPPSPDFPSDLCFYMNMRIDNSKNVLTVSAFSTVIFLSLDYSKCLSRSEGAF